MTLTIITMAATKRCAEHVNIRCRTENFVKIFFLLPFY